MLSIQKVKAETRDRYVLVKVSLENQGPSVVGPGTMLGRQTSSGGAVRTVEFRNSINIPPGCTAKVSQLLSGMRELELTGYRQSDGVIIPFSGGRIKRLSFLRSVAQMTGRWWDEVLLPRSRSLAARLEIGRRVSHGVVWTRDAFRSIHAKLVRWQDEVLLPRTRSVAARFKALHENRSLRLADAKQRRERRAQVERQAWESLDTEIMQWWEEVLLPRTRSVAARLKALHESRSLRLADAKQREHRAQAERQAWESFDAEIMRWWDRVATEIQKRVELYRTRRSLPR
jgi:hypothetical protein